MAEQKRGKFGEPWEYKENRGYGELLNCRGQLVMETSQSKELMGYVSACVNAIHTSGLTPAKLEVVGALVNSAQAALLTLTAAIDQIETLDKELGYQIETEYERDTAASLRAALARFDAAGEGE